MKRWATVRWAARIVALRKGGMGAMASALPRSPHSARLFVAAWPTGHTEPSIAAQSFETR